MVDQSRLIKAAGEQLSSKTYETRKAHRHAIAHEKIADQARRVQSRLSCSIKDSKVPSIAAASVA